MKKTIAICGSLNFAKDMIEVADALKKRGLGVKIPFSALDMKRANDFRISRKFKSIGEPERRRRRMKNHIRKIEKSDAVLIVNFKKKGIEGYIGGATLIEMAIADYLGKKIYILNPISKSLALYEEIVGFKNIFIDGDLSKIRI